MDEQQRRDYEGAGALLWTLIGVGIAIVIVVYFVLRVAFRI